MIAAVIPTVVRFPLAIAFIAAGVWFIGNLEYFIRRLANTSSTVVLAGIFFSITSIALASGMAYLLLSGRG